MSAPSANTAFTGSVPANYERYLRPALFEPFAVDLAARVAPKPGARLLELACGTGVVTRRLLERMAPDARLAATDLNQAMIDSARASVGDDPRLEWRAADAQSLPFPDGAFDAVVIQFGVMFFPDKVGAYREARRVLKPGGRLLFNTWTSLPRNGASLVIQERLIARFPADPPGFLHIPFGYHDDALIRAELIAAGFQIESLAAAAFETVSPTADDFAAGIATGTPLSGILKERGADLELIRRDLAEALAARYGAAPMKAPMEAWVAVAVNA